jgi:membrane protein implicated in regulation of membrane protease activity
VLLLIAIILAIFVLPTPWNVVVLALGLIGEVGEASFGIWYSRRRRAAAGAEAMIGALAKVVEDCRPSGRVSLKGELWEAVCEQGADRGTRVRIEAIDGLTLIVAPLDEAGGKTSRK